MSNLSVQSTYHNISFLQFNEEELKDFRKNLVHRIDILFAAFSGSLLQGYEKHKEDLNLINPALQLACSIYASALEILSTSLRPYLPLPTVLQELVTSYIKLTDQNEIEQMTHQISLETLLDFAFFLEPPTQYFKAINYTPFVFTSTGSCVPKIKCNVKDVKLGQDLTIEYAYNSWIVNAYRGRIVANSEAALCFAGVHLFQFRPLQVCSVPLSDLDASGRYVRSYEKGEEDRNNEMLKINRWFIFNINRSKPDDFLQPTSVPSETAAPSKKRARDDE